MTWFTEPWTFEFMRWALLCALVLAGIHAYLGFHVVRRGVLFVDLATAQLAALGSAVGVVLGVEHDTFGGYLISFAFALGAAGLFSVLRSDRFSKEAIIAVFYGLASAATFVVLEKSPHGMEEVKHLMLGQILTVNPSDILYTALVYAAVAVVYAFVHGRVSEVSEGKRQSLGLDLLFFGTFALIVTTAVKLVGVLLVFCLLVLPSVAALMLATTPGRQLVWGWSIAGVSALVGLHLSFHLDMPAGPVLCLTLGVALLLAWFAGAVIQRRSP
jgi:zinc/manganese transport system permease protein